MRSFPTLVLVSLFLSPAGLALQSQILEVSSNSLTTYLPSASTAVQGVRPLAIQRGVGLDGSIRAGASQRWALAGNPFENAWRGHLSEGGVRLDTGAISPQDIDLALPASVPWVIGRSYNPVQEDSGASH